MKICANPNSDAPRYLEGQEHSMHLHHAVLEGWVQPADVFTRFYADQTNAFWLDREHSAVERFSVLGAGKVLSRAQFEAFEVDSDSLTELPFSWRPGAIVLADYEGGQTLISAERAILFDHDGKRLFFVGLFDSADDFRVWHHEALLRIGLSGGQLASFKAERGGVPAAESVQLRHQPHEYLRKIEQVKSAIAAGDVYQLCLTNEIQLHTQIDPLFAFLRLREINPAPYSAYLKVGDTSLVCASPELFLSLSGEGVLSTKPIKGTRPRSSDPEVDEQIRLELQANEKERAENLMIVDLMRNDLGRVAKVGSVEVSKLFDVESYAAVHQLVSTVSAELEDNLTWADALQAAFPGGSMTGAPKIRAMQIIAELENGPRGLYSGAIGWVGVDGACEFAMTIRSIVLQAGLAKIGVGGGITIDSDAAEELEETRLKAKVLLQALNASDPWA
jgi:para-aminobenzoate synthetase component I